MTCLKNAKVIGKYNKTTFKQVSDDFDRLRTFTYILWCDRVYPGRRF